VRIGGDNTCIEIKSVQALRSYLRSERSLKGLAIQGLNLTSAEMDYALTSLSAHGSYFLGCALTAKSEAHIRATGGTIFPDFHDLPFNAYRSSLYTVEELMAGYERGNRASLADTADGRIYSYFQKHRVNNRPIPIIPALSFRIHDHAIDNALYDLLYPKGAEPLKVVAVMGGHKMARDHDMYLKTAKIASHLSELGYLVTSGGGPGAMEATNLGGYFSGHPERELENAVRSMAKQPRYQDKLYLEAAYEVIDRYPIGGQNLAVPTWFYGHEPTNLFASHIAKYFANSLREDGMLAIAKCGAVFAPGSAGTIQEVFMDAAQNRYKSYGTVSPMVFVGTTYWTKTKPVYRLLKSLAKGCEYEDLVTIADDPEEVVEFIQKKQPISS
jgi:predicted Rossmann-fold nucleotide-binding protein